MSLCLLFMCHAPERPPSAVATKLLDLLKKVRRRTRTHAHVPPPRPPAPTAAAQAS